MSTVRRLLYEAAATVSSLALLPALASGRWREGLAERLGFGSRRAAGTAGRPIWIHGASVGEVLAARGLIAALLGRSGSERIFLSTFTLSGREAARETYAAWGDRVDYALLPLDWWGAPGRVCARVRPRLFILLETEIWPGLLHELTARGVPTVMVNGRISARSLPRYRALKWFFRPFLETLDLICVRTENDAERFRTIGAPGEKIRVTGNIKYEKVSREGPPEKVRRWRESLGGAPVLVAGSLRRGEARIVLQAYRRLKESNGELVLVLAPRHPRRFDRTGLLREGESWKEWSSLDGIRGGEGEIVLVDTVGDLPGIYGAATLAFVGGTLADGRGHNMLEPAGLGVPVLFGPEYRNFEDEAAALLAAGGAFEVTGGSDLADRAGRLFADPAALADAGEHAAAAAASFEGALGRTLDAVAGIGAVLT